MENMQTNTLARAPEGGRVIKTFGPCEAALAPARARPSVEPTSNGVEFLLAWRESCCELDDDYDDDAAL